jgi:hypothetical protein
MTTDRTEAEEIRREALARVKRALERIVGGAA